MKRLVLTPLLLQMALISAQITPTQTASGYGPVTAQNLTEGNRQNEKDALEILNKVLENYASNSPESLASYSYANYEKFTIDGNTDTATSPEFQKILANSKLMLWERSIKTDYQKGRGMKKTVLLDSLAGSAAVVPESLTLGDNREGMPFLLKKENRPLYNFYLANDNLSDAGGSLKVFFKKKNNEDGKPDGFIEIDPQSFAVKSIETYGRDRRNFTRKTWQQYGGRWFLTDMKIHRQLARLEQSRMAKMNEKVPREADLFLDGTVQYSDIQVNPDLSGENFSGYYYQRSNSINYNPEELRPQPLTEREAQTSAFLKPMLERFKIDNKLEGLAALWRLNLRTGVVDWDLIKTLAYNQVEHLRLGLGARLNERFSPYVSPGAYAGYGLYDKKWKYGADVLINFTPKERVNTLRLAYHDDTFSAGRFNDNLWDGFMKLMNNGVDLNNNKIVYQKGGLVSFESDFARNVTGRLTAARNEEELATPYDYKGLGNSFVNTSAGLSLKFSPNSEYVMTPRGRFVVEKGYPEFFLDVEQGFKALGGDFNYTKASLLYTQVFKNPLGETGIRAWGGVILGDAPIWHHYSMNGLSAGGDGMNFNFLSYLGFATMRGGYFYADKFFGTFIQHTLPWHFKSFGQQTSSIALLHRGEIGNLKNLQDHKGEFGTIDHYYQEVGLQWNNFLSSWFNLAVFYKVGYYSAPEWKNNLGIQLKFRIFGF